MAERQIQASSDEAAQRRTDRALAAIVFALALLVYLRTLLPDVGGPEDTPKFQYLGAVLGTAHPPGYPLHTMLSHVFSWIPIGTIAYRANLLSAVAGALAAGIAYLVARTIGAGRAAAVFGALTIAFGAAFWTYSVLAEVYTLSAALLLAVMFWLLRWKATRRSAHLYAASACFAVALGNHLFIVACAPAIALFLLTTDPRSVLRPRTLLTAGAIVVSGFLQYGYIVVRTWQETPYSEAAATTVADLATVIRGGDYSEYLFAFTWQQFLDERWPAFQQLVSRELGPVGLICAGAGILLLLLRDTRAAALLGLSFAGLVAFGMNVIGDMRGFLVMPLALAAPFLAIGGDAVQRLVSPSGRSGIVVTLLLLAYPLWPLRANFSANDWSGRTEDARFFRAFYNQLPQRAAVVPEDYVADSILTYLHIESGEPRTLLRPRPFAVFVRELWDAGEQVYALNGRYADIAPRGFHFIPVRLPPDAQQARTSDGRPRRAYRLVDTLETIPFGDARWHDVTGVASHGRVGILIDNYHPFDARVVLYAAADVPLHPELTDDYMTPHGRPTIDVQPFDRQDESSRGALDGALAADGQSTGLLGPGGRYVVRIEHRVNDNGQFAAWGLALGAVPRQVIGFAQPDRPHPSRALLSPLPDPSR